jgi:hypothetical protein
MRQSIESNSTGLSSASRHQFVIMFASKASKTNQAKFGQTQANTQVKIGYARSYSVQYGLARERGEDPSFDLTHPLSMENGPIFHSMSQAQQEKWLENYTKELGRRITAFNKS